MITNVQEILDYSNIADVIRHFVPDLKKNGANYTANCPFHNEKSGSFSVSESKNMWKCFGCGEGGSMTTFVMKHKKLSWYDAILTIANISNITPKVEKSEKAKETIARQTTLSEHVRKASDLYRSLLQTTPEAKTYIEERLFTPEILQQFQVGYCPPTSEYLKTLKDTKDKETAKEAFILGMKEEKNTYYDRMYGRITFPIFNNIGTPIGLAGRTLSKDKKVPKYINPSDTDLYKKDTTLYALNFAYKAIKEMQCAILVEGYTDVMAMHQKNKINTIGTGGTAFTANQAKEIKKYANNLILFFDGDTAGETATVRAIKICLSEGLKPFVYSIPKDSEEKVDPCDFIFANPDTEIKISTSIDGISYILKFITKDNNVIADYKNDIPEIVEILSYLTDHDTDYYINKIVADFDRDEAKNFKSSIKEDIRLAKERKAKKKFTDAQKRDIELYGFYEENNMYYYRISENNYIKKSNFIIQPKLLVKGKKRIFEIINYRGTKETIDISPQDMTSVNKLCGIVEGMGDFLFEGNDTDLKLIKRKIFTEQLECIEYSKLGYDSKTNCYIMGNGIFAPNGEFYPADEFGVVKYLNHNLFIPAYSKIITNPQEYEAQRKFKHYSDKKVSFKDWSAKFYSLFNLNGAVGIGFGIGTIFRDIIFGQTDFFPILYNFGIPGTGKSTMTYSLMHLFGKRQNEINISGSSTIKGKMATFAQFENAIVHLEEFKNASAIKDIETYKGLYNAHARVTKTYSNDSRTNVIPILSTAIICSQEKPTCEEAFYTRCIILTYVEGQKNFLKLKELQKIEDAGITSVLQEIYSHRMHFQEQYPSILQEVILSLNERYLNKTINKTRLILNTSTILAIFKTLEGKLEFPFTYAEIEEFMISIMHEQEQEFGKGLELQKFWEIIEDCIDKARTINTPDDFVLHDGDQNLYIRMNSFYNAYAKRYKDIYGQPGMDKKSIIHYIKQSDCYVKSVESWRFGNSVSSAMILDYPALQQQGVNLVRNMFAERAAKVENLEYEKLINDITYTANNKMAHLSKEDMAKYLQEKINELLKPSKPQQISLEIGSTLDLDQETPF